MPPSERTVTIDYATFGKSFAELGGRIVYYTDQIDGKDRI